ncbi:cyclopropane-fatty-acyl-phospholipid synthase family protein [soil metagenome]
MTSPVLNDYAVPPTTLAPRRGRLVFWALQQAARDWQGRGLVVRTPEGEEHRFGPPSPDPAFIHVHNWKLTRRVMAAGDIGLAEGYMAGEWETPDLARLLAVLADNFERIDSLTHGNPLARAVNWMVHRLGRLNTRKGSKKNIIAHYDLGNAFYERWLDPSMTYSSALWTRPDMSLEAAQREKYATLAASIGLEAHHTLLEIGCGWGGFAEYAAREIGCHVTGLTISPSQHDFAVQRMARAGLSDKVDIRLTDYRDVTDTFDRVVSIEMFEAVGEKWWPTYFQVLRDRLKAGGQAGLQIITIRDDLFEDYRSRVDFIQKYVFPGGLLPSEAVLKNVIEPHGLQIQATKRFGQDYARTLHLWAKGFSSVASGMNTVFDRQWLFYLAYCEAGFATGRTNVVQLTLSRD